MGNKNIFFYSKLFLLLFFLLENTYAQNEFNEKFIKLSQFETDEYLDGNFETGKYYLIRNENNQIKEIQIKKYKNSNKQGEWLTFSKTFDGLCLTSVCNYKNDILHGYYFSTDNHTESQEGYYKNGIKNGLWKFIETTDGYTIESEGEYKNGKKHGVWTKIDFGLQEKEIITFKNGKNHGKYYFENKEYKTSITGEYKNNLKHGVWVTKDKLLPIINSDGTTSQNLKTEFFKNGILITK